MNENSANRSPSETVNELCKWISDPENWVVWFGSGPSTQTYPGFERLLKNICLACSVSYEEKIPIDYYALAEECKNTNEIKFYETICSEYKNDPEQINTTYLLFLKMGFKAYITTNYDPSLKTAHYLMSTKFGGSKVYDNQDLDSTKISNGNVFYIHGLASEQCTRDYLLLAESDLNKFYLDEKNSNFFKALFLNANVLFVGYSLSECAVQTILKNIQRYFCSVATGDNKYHSTNKRSLVALTRDESGPTNSENIENRFNEVKKRLDEHGIHTVLYNEHRALPEILRAFIDKTTSAASNEGNDVPSRG